MRRRLTAPGGGEGDGGEEDGRASIVASGDPAPVLEAAEHDLVAAAAFVSALVVFDGHDPGFPSRNAGCDALCLKGVPVPVCAVAAVSQHPLGPGQIIEQRRSAGVVADLASGHEEADWAAVGFSNGVKLYVDSSFGTTDEPPETPFFTRRLDAVRCALRKVA